MKIIEKVLLAWLLLLLAVITLGAITSWQYNYVAAYTFFISWGVMFLYYAVTLRNYHSLIMLGLAAGAAGLYFTILKNPAGEAALLLGKISLSVFTALLAIRLYRKRAELEANATIFMGLIGLLLFQVVLQNGTAEQQLEALSVSGFANYFTTGLIAHILLNDTYSNILTKGERAVLLMQVIFCLYNISLMLIFNFSAG